MSIFEVIMLVCFGAAWPFSIYKSYTSRSTEGKSISFLIVILVGYVAGILHKVFYQFDIVMYLYILNFMMVLTDLLIYYRNRRINAISASLYPPERSHSAASAK
ncbi:PQ-loop domain-containing transporter [Desulfosporosinus youngiae]|uniref:PQ loop repeat protein n=1 Tax=Desulfosporosinus youngiae DSM 17734 TaxID=768710 RepID=H5XXN0_9FIRM|nr:PQ-loop domain-containing transporter [Desulfosporosinus youngiae]EHQ91236.1 PQ loop repeat protein [Desulfosporosinus youngiae DSM 17734]